HSTDKPEIAPSGKLAAAKIDTLTRWVKMGLPYPPGKEPIDKGTHNEKVTITDADGDWWAYRPLKQPPLPAVKATSRIRNGIDAFILAKLEAKGLTPGGEADRVALARRLYYDLTGLPPTPREVDDYVNDPRPDA